MSHLQRLSSLVILVMLSGCQTLASPDPLARAPERLPAECRWMRTDQASPELWVRASVEALETRGYVIRHTETRLGVVSAERVTRLPGLGAVDRPFFGGSGVWGSVGGGSGSGFSLGIGTGFGSRYHDDPVEIERVSVIVGEQEVSITRDASVVDTGGYVDYARTENSSDFCRELSGSIDARVRALESQQ